MQSLLLLRRADELERSKPAVARAIRDNVQTWPGKVADIYLWERIRDGKADAGTLWAALQRRESIRANAPDGLRAIKDHSGSLRGWAAILSGESQEEAKVLDGDDREAQRALLAGARVVREALPLDKVGRILKKGPSDLAVAAERYLVSEDSPAARRLIYSLHPGEGLILGARQANDPGHVTYRAFDAMEKGLRDEVREKNGPKEIFALLSAGYWGDAGQIIVRLEGTEATVSVYGGSDKPNRRTLLPADVDHMRAFLSANRIDNLAPLNTPVCDGMQYEYVHLTKEGGCRVFMNNPGDEPSGVDAIYADLVDFFGTLAKRGGK